MDDDYKISPSVFKGDIVRAATMNGTRGWMKVLVLISVRMGADELNLSYRQPIQVTQYKILILITDIIRFITHR